MIGYIAFHAKANDSTESSDRPLTITQAFLKKKKKKFNPEGVKYNISYNRLSKKYKSSLPNRICDKQSYQPENRPDVNLYNVQLIYVFPKGSFHFNQVKEKLVYITRWVDRFYKQGSKGKRAIFWDRNGACGKKSLDIRFIRLKHDASYYKNLSTWKMAEALDEEIMPDLSKMENKVSLFYVNNVATNRTTIEGYAYPDFDDKPGLDNPVFKNDTQAVILAGHPKKKIQLFSNKFNLADVAAHELTHAFGAVSGNSPNSSRQADGHCLDGTDVMCLGGDRCKVWREVLDCKKDDYFSVNPRKGSWLSKHWNVANSPYLLGSPLREPAIEERTSESILISPAG